MNPYTLLVLATVAVAAVAAWWTMSGSRRRAEARDDSVPRPPSSDRPPSSGRPTDRR